MDDGSIEVVPETTVSSSASLPGLFSGPGDVSGLILDRLKQGQDASVISNSIVELRRKQAAIGERAAEVNEQTAEAAARTAEALTRGKMSVEASMIAARAAFGGDIADPASRKLELAKQHEDNYNQAKAIRDDLIAKSRVSFFDNPVEYISNQLEIPQLTQTHNLLAANANSALSEINALDATLTAEHAAMVATSKTLSESAAADAALIASRDLKAAGLQMRFNSLASDIDAFNAIKDGNKEVMDAKMKAWEIGMTEQGRQLQLRAEQRAIESHNIFMQEHGDKAAVKKAEMDIYAAGLAVLGQPLPDGSQLDRAYQLYKSGTPGFKERYEQIMLIGRNKLITGDSSLGSSPGAAGQILLSNPGNFKDTPYMPVIKEVADTTNQVLRSNPELQKNRAAAAEAVNSVYYGTLAKDGKTRQGGKLQDWNANPENSSIYKDPGLEIISASKFVSNNPKVKPFYDAILAPSLAAKTVSINANAMIEQTHAAIKSGKLSVEQAADGIAEYYDTVRAYNATRAAKVGLPPQKGYNVRIDSTGSLGYMAHSFDLSDPTSTRQLFVTMQAKEYIGQVPWAQLQTRGL